MRQRKGREAECQEICVAVSFITPMDTFPGHEVEESPA